MTLIENSALKDVGNHRHTKWSVQKYSIVVTLVLMKSEELQSQ